MCYIILYCFQGPILLHTVQTSSVLSLLHIIRTVKFCLCSRCSNQFSSVFASHCANQFSSVFVPHFSNQFSSVFAPHCSNRFSSVSAPHCSCQYISDSELFTLSCLLLRASMAESVRLEPFILPGKVETSADFNLNFKILSDVGSRFQKHVRSCQ